MWTKSRSLKLSQVMVWLSVAVLLAASAALPALLQTQPEADQILEFTAGGARARMAYWVFLLSMWASAVPALAALICLHLLLCNIGRDEVFIPANVRYIRIVSWCCFLVAAIYLALAAVYFYLTGLIIALFMSFVGMILRVVKNVIAQAIAIKTEHDLTV